MPEGNETVTDDRIEEPGLTAVAVGTFVNKEGEKDLAKIQCVELDKKQFDIFAKLLWDILYKNMSVIAPFEKTYEESFEKWHQAVKCGLKRKERKILLIRHKKELIGFLQYYVKDDVFMVEEIQIMPKYQVTYGVIGVLAEHLLSEIPADTIYMDAYADNRNETSKRIIKKLGMSKVRNEENGLEYYRGYYETARFKAIYTRRFS